jgi:hypothetical protein
VLSIWYSIDFLLHIVNREIFFSFNWTIVQASKDRKNFTFLLNFALDLSLCNVRNSFEPLGIFQLKAFSLSALASRLAIHKTKKKSDFKRHKREKFWAGKIGLTRSMDASCVEIVKRINCWLSRLVRWMIRVCESPIIITISLISSHSYPPRGIFSQATSEMFIVLHNSLTSMRHIYGGYLSLRWFIYRAQNGHFTDVFNGFSLEFRLMRLLRLDWSESWKFIRKQPGNLFEPAWMGIVENFWESFI